MRRAIILFIPALVGILVAGPAISAGSADGAPSGAPTPGLSAKVAKAGYSDGPADHAPGEVVVTFRKGVDRATKKGLHAAQGVRVLERVGGPFKFDVVKAPAGRSAARAARAYERLPGVATAEPNWIRYPLQFIPNDPNWSHMWGLHNTGQNHETTPATPSFLSSGTNDADIDAPDAWVTQKGSSAVRVAVIDSGVQVNHADLDNNIWVNNDPPGGGDQDGNGYVDDTHGWDTAENNNTLLGSNTVEGWDHGTHVAGTIAAETNNAAGVPGVCGGNGATKGCQIMVLKFMKAFPDGQGGQVMGGLLSDELEAINYARMEQAHIINGSFGGGPWSKAERNAFKAAGAQSGILSVLAAGNDALDNDMAIRLQNGATSPAFPASYNIPHILSVAASNHQDRYGFSTRCVELAGNTRSQCAFTNFGRYSVDVAAPGVDILSTLPFGVWNMFDGTSMATPHVAGVAGLLKSQTPGLSPLAIKNKIMNGADRAGLPLNTQNDTAFPNGTQNGKFTRTAGRLNANGALGAGTGNASPNHDGDIPGARRIAGKKSDKVAWPNDVNDIYKRKLKKGKVYRATVSVPKKKDFDLYVLKPGTVEVWQKGSAMKASFNGPGKNEAAVFKAKRGITFFHVSSWFSAGRYTLKIKCLSC